MNMKQLSLVVALTVFTLQLGFSQIKKQYKDSVFNQTTVLVKEDKMSDIDILNSMDLDDIGMDQIIQIRVGTDQAEPAKAVAVAQLEPVKEEPKVTLPEEPVVEEVAIQETVVEETVAEVTPTRAPIAQKEIKTSSRASNTNTATRSTSKSSRASSASRVSKKSSKSKIRRFKKVKRKKFKSGKKLSCFKF